VRKRLRRIWRRLFRPNPPQRFDDYLARIGRLLDQQEREGGHWTMQRWHEAIDQYRADDARRMEAWRAGEQLR
jgi:hypothetical protein